MLAKLRSIYTGLYEGFYSHRLLENASSLSYYTLMSLVPILAVLFGIAKGFGIESNFREEVIHAVPNQEVLAEEVVQFAERMLERTKGGVIAGVGILFLLWSSLGLLGNFENTLNDIWNVKESRSLFKRAGDFLAFIVLCPLFFVIFSSTTLFITTELTDFFEKKDLIRHFGPALWLGFKMVPILLSFIIFTFLYSYLPAKRPPLIPVIFSALITSFLFHLAQWLYVKFQLNISSYGAIYGSFAAIPLFLLWLQLSWFITLLGAELSYRFSKI